MSKPKIFYHVAANCAGCNGIADYWKALDAAGVGFVVYSANDAGLLARAAVHPQATLVYRDVEASTVHPPDYNRPAAEMAGYYWQRTLDRLPVEVWALRGRAWLELLNEPGREPEQARWVGALMAGMARLALADGWRVCGPGWAAGNPEPEAWGTPEWRDYLALCAQFPDRVGVSVHEYSLDNDIGAGWGWLVGRFRFVHEAAAAAGLRRPALFVTEAGWTLNSMPDDAQVKRDIERLARLYAAHANIVGASLWTLQGGAGNGNLPARLNALMGWLAWWTVATELPDAPPLPEPEPPPDEEEPMAENLLTNGSFENGWTDATDFPGQHPKGWTVVFNTGEAMDGYQFSVGEAVHKNADLLPPEERSVFIWDGRWTLKVFAGNQAIWPRLKQTVTLPAGRYRLLTPVWVDCYHWRNGKDYNLDLRHAGWMVKANGAVVADWWRLEPGRLNAPWAEFDHAGGPLELAVHLQARWPIASNNFWLDGWSLTAVPVAPPPPLPPPPARHKAIVVKLPQHMSAAEWQQAAEYAYPFRHTMTASHDDMLTVLRGGNAESYVKLAWPERQAGVAALIEGEGYRWEGVLGRPPFVATHYPVDGERRVTQVFGARPEVYAPLGLPGHEGVDLAAAKRAPVRAVAAGTIGRVTTGGNYGNCVRVVHSGGWETLYAHLDSVAPLQTGAVVAAGALLGYAGSTGNSTATHLHFGLRREGDTYTDAAGNRWPSGIFDPTEHITPLLGIDLLPYLRGDGRLYEVRHPSGATETFRTDSDGQTFYTVKNSAWEQLYADEQYIWRGLDTSPGGGRFYVQRETGKAMARWCPRRMWAGQTWTGPGHVVQFYMKADCTPSAPNSGNATNRMTLVARHASRTWNGVTVADVVEMTNGSETWFYGRDLGLVAWKAAWGESAIAQVYAPGQRQPMAREKLPCSV